MLESILSALISLSILLGPPSDPLNPGSPSAAAPREHPSRAAPRHMEWTVDGVKREGLVYLPPSAATQPSPLIFAFHGHGGTARNASRTFDLQKHWPEAIVVYLEGLPTPGALTDPDGKRNGWQKAAGDQSDRDLKFFDAALADLRKQYKVDDSRIYATGHSNGGAFTYLLWSQRGDVFAAVAPSAAGGSLATMTSLKPKPAMHIAGRKDTTVPFSLQQRMMDQVKKVDHCEAEGTEWAKDCTIYKSREGDTPFVAMIHDGDHAYDKDAPALIVRFFKEHTNEAAKGRPSNPGANAQSPSTPVAPPSR